MKPFLVLAAMMACVSTLSAQEIKLTTATWDSLAIPLGLTPFYLTVNSAEKATSVALEMDLYVKGKFSRKINPIALDRKGLGNATVPLNVKCAITFAPCDDNTSKGTVVLEWDSTRRGSSFIVSEEEFPMNSSQGGIAASSKFIVPGRIPVFAITVGGNGIKSATNVEEMPKENPESSVLIGYLKVE